MRAEPLTDLSRLCLHTITTKPWNVEQAAKYYASAGIKGITVWRDALEGRNIVSTGQMLRDHDLTIVSLCRGGFFASKDPSKRQTAIEDNRKAIEEAYLLGTNKIVLVCGADPAQSLEDSRKQIQEGIYAVIPDAEAANVKLAIEPLHPMYADVRSAINTLKQANDLVEALNPPVGVSDSSMDNISSPADNQASKVDKLSSTTDKLPSTLDNQSSAINTLPSPAVGVAVDVYHLWWDPDLEKEIERCGRLGNLLAFHVSDWKTPTVDFLYDRGIMGEGCIPLRKIRTWVENAGFKGFIEVEIFSKIYWQENQAEYLRRIVKSYTTYA
jgi:sugar phosphate isomerase/epimerase